MAVDEAKLKEEMSKMTKEDLEKELLKIRERQHTQQMKQKLRGGNTEYQKRQRERYKLLKERAVAAGLWETIDAEAKQRAKGKLIGQLKEAAEASE